MKFLTFLVLFLLSISSLHAAGCKYLMNSFVGAYRFENYKCASNDDSCYTEQDEYNSVKEILIMPVGLGYGVGLSVKLLDDKSNVVMEHFINERSSNQNNVVSCNQSEEVGLSIKSELPGLNGSKIYVEIIKKGNDLSLEHFISFAGVESQKVVSLKINKKL
jgi:hypothetical protein